VFVSDEKPDPKVEEAKEVLEANMKVTEAAEKVNQKDKK
jgi:hypothetical protein